MSRALPDHSPETLVRKARAIYDVAARTFRRLPTDDAGAVLRSAAEAMLHAHDLHAGQTRSEFDSAARLINHALDSLNALRARRGEKPLSP